MSHFEYKSIQPLDRWGNCIQNALKIKFYFLTFPFYGKDMNFGSWDSTQENCSGKTL